jgi:lipopolysaccharide export system permease protein
VAAQVAAPPACPGQRVKLLDRYLLREFTGYLALGLLGFIVIFIVVDVFEKMDVFLDHGATLAQIMSFYLYRAPEVAVQVMPVALLLATFLALGQLNKFGELTAMRTTGLSLVRILAPVFAVAATASIASLLLGEFVVPPANREREEIYDGQIRGVRREIAHERPDLTYVGHGGNVYYMRLYVVREERMHEVALQSFEDGQLVRRIDAAEATWDGDEWVFSSGVERTFAGDQEIATSFDQLMVEGLEETPEDFAKETRQPSEMNYFELRKFVDRQRASGVRVAPHLVDLHVKLAFPLVNLIVVVIGASIASQLRLKSAALSFGLSVAIAFVYYAFLRTGQALGHSGALPPYAAAWMGDFVFMVIGAVMLQRAQKR